jgi:hypothetical protein
MGLGLLAPQAHGQATEAPSSAISESIPGKHFGSPLGLNSLLEFAEL